MRSLWARILNRGYLTVYYRVAGGQGEPLATYVRRTSSKGARDVVSLNSKPLNPKVKGVA